MIEEKTKLIVNNVEMKRQYKCNEKIITFYNGCAFIVELYPDVFVTLFVDYQDSTVSHFCSGYRILDNDIYPYYIEDDLVISCFVKVKNKLNHLNITKRKFLEEINKVEILNDPRPIYEELSIPYYPSFSILNTWYTGMLKIFN